MSTATSVATHRLLPVVYDTSLLAVAEEPSPTLPRPVIVGTVSNSEAGGQVAWVPSQSMRGSQPLMRARHCVVAALMG